MLTDILNLWQATHADVNVARTSELPAKSLESLRTKDFLKSGTTVLVCCTARLIANNSQARQLCKVQCIYQRKPDLPGQFQSLRTGTSRRKWGRTDKYSQSCLTRQPCWIYNYTTTRDSMLVLSLRSVGSETTRCNGSDESEKREHSAVCAKLNRWDIFSSSQYFCYVKIVLIWISLLCIASYVSLDYGPFALSVRRAAFILFV